MLVPAIIDIEASGLGPGTYPIEIGYVLADGRAECLLVKPEPEWRRWDARAERLHGISRATLMKRGRPVRDVAEQLNRIFAGTTVYSDAWGNDQTWLALLFDAAGILPRFRLESLRAILSETQLAHWHPTQQRIARELDLVRHRASHDARILQLTYLRTRCLAEQAEAFSEPA